ncbi:hypothetical protein CON36_28225 [Bacillus cereus]|uniref:Uncharacterized protein n=2 Tax=Bacillus cereus group TaxID=86661 RepID=A0A9X6SUM7_BACCE|nr:MULTISPECIES: GNAT family N-acetyltransferase [Bacillus cereus group]PDZ95441.1 hypothetical protein CON36_28225 [Bacillus cereus]PFJ27152.1 hypothetical protein COJ15_34545 [Bacillus thuringiensis]
MERPEKKDFELIIELMERDARLKMKVGISTNKSIHKLFLMTSKNELILEFNSSEKEIIVKQILIYNQRKGIGTYIINFLKKYMKQKGYTKLTLLHAQYYDMKCFAEKLGFDDAYTHDFRYEYVIEEDTLEDAS